MVLIWTTFTFKKITLRATQGKKPFEGGKFLNHVSSRKSHRNKSARSCDWKVFGLFLWITWKIRSMPEHRLKTSKMEFVKIMSVWNWHFATHKKEMVCECSSCGDLTDIVYISGIWSSSNWNKHPNIFIICLLLLFSFINIGKPFINTSYYPHNQIVNTLTTGLQTNRNVFCSLARYAIFR